MISKKQTALVTTTAVIMAVTVLAMLGGQTLTGNPSVTINETGNYKIGDTMIVGVTCNANGKYIKGWECKLNFNKNVIQAVSVAEGNFFRPYSTFFNAGIINNPQGKIINIYNLIVGTGNVTVNKYLFNVTFTVIGFGYSNITLYDTGLCNETQYLTGVVINNASLFIYSPYDMNNDKTVNVQDLISIANHYGETGVSGWIKEDVNKDGKIRVIDMVLVTTHWGPY